MVEREKIGELESFRMEIKNIVESLGDTNGDAMNVKEFGELDEEDMRHWQECKDLLSALDNLDSHEDKEKIVQKLQVLEVKAKRLAAEVQDINANVANKDKQSKYFFNAWLNNINPFSVINAMSALGLSLEKGKKLSHDHIELYAKDGWKNIDSAKN